MNDGKLEEIIQKAAAHDSMLAALRPLAALYTDEAMVSAPMGGDAFVRVKVADVIRARAIVETIDARGGK